MFGRGGIGVYVRGLVRALGAAYPDDELALYARQLRRPAGTPWTVRAASTPANASLHAGRLPGRVLRALASVGWGADRLLGGVDVVHWTDYALLPSVRAPVVATIHDVLFDELPACYPPPMAQGLRDVTRQIVARAAHVIVPSTRTRDALGRLYGVPAEQMTVVPHGVDTRAPSAPGSASEPYVLFVGTLEPRKNLPRLLSAFDAVHPRAPRVRLRLAGPRGWGEDVTLAAIAERSHVEYLGPVDRDRLGRLYAGALAVAYPSLGEGFGLPVLEAMAHGKPVLVGADTACSDLAGDAALVADPRNVGALADALYRLIDDEALRERLGAAGRERARAHPWERTARETHAVYERIAS